MGQRSGGEPSEREEWLIDLDGSSPSPSPSPSNSWGNASANAVADAPVNDGEVQVLRELVGALQSQVLAQQKQLESEQEQLGAKDKQIGELHILLQQTQAALPVAKEYRRWWRFWQ